MVLVKEEPVSFEQITWPYFQILRYMAILPFRGKDYSYIFTRFLSIYIPFTSVMNTFIHIASAVNRMYMGKFELDDIYEPVILMCGAVRCIILLDSRSEYKKLIDECHAIWSICSHSEHLIVIQYNKLLRIFFNVVFYSTAGIYVAFVCVGLISYVSSFRANDTQIRKLAFKWFVDDVHESPNYEIIFIFQNLVAWTGTIWVPGAEISASFALIFSSAYFRILQDRLLILIVQDMKQGNEEHIYEKILDRVRFHQRLYKLCINIDKLTRSIFLVQFLGTGYVLSLIIVKLSGTDPDRFKSLPMVSLCFMQLFMCQCAPEFLLNESEAVSIAAYFIYTPTMSLRTQKVLNIILRRAQKPVETRAGGIIKLCLETFGSLMSSAVSFIVLLRNFTN